MSRNDAIRIPRRRQTPRIAGMFLAAAGVCFGAFAAHAQVRRPLRPAAQRFAAARPNYTRPAANPHPYAAFALHPAPIERASPRAADSALERGPEFGQGVQVRRRPATVRRPPPARPQPAPAPQTRSAVAPPVQAPAPIERSEPQVHQSQAGAPLQRPAPSNNPGGAATPLVSPNHPGQTQQHLAPWMQAHSNLPLAEQQRALDNEAGFRNLPPQEQDKLHQQLTHLNSMTPEQRKNHIQQAEYMERLAPAQRKQVNNAMTQLGSLPEYRRHIVGTTFYHLRDMPPAQRQAYMNSPQFRSEFNEQERGTINGLLDITPIWPPIQAQPPPH